MNNSHRTTVLAMSSSPKDQDQSNFVPVNSNFNLDDWTIDFQSKCSLNNGFLININLDIFKYLPVRIFQFFNDKVQVIP